MTTKTLTIIAAAVLGLAVLAFGKEAISYLSGALAHTWNTMKDTIPHDLEIPRLKSMLGKLDAAIERRRAALIDMQLQSERLEGEIKSLCQRLAADRAALEKAADLLEEEQDSYVIDRSVIRCDAFASHTLRLLQPEVCLCTTDHDA